MTHTDFYLQTKEVHGEMVEYRKCSSCSRVLIEGREPSFNLYCGIASQNEQRRLDEIKKYL